MQLNLPKARGLPTVNDEESNFFTWQITIDMLPEKLVCFKAGGNMEKPRESLSRVCYKSGVLCRDEAFGGVIYNANEQSFHPVNPLGYRIASCLYQPITLDEIVKAINSIIEDPIDYSRIKTDIMHFLRSLDQLNLIKGFSQLATDQGFKPSQNNIIKPFGERIKLKAPLNVSLALIFRCNLLCKHCYVESTNEMKPDNLNKEEVLRILDSLHDLGVLDIAFSGGEAFLFDGLFEVLSHAHELGFHTSLNTNGTLITKPNAEKLKATGLNLAKVSIDSPHPEIHNRFRGQSMAFERTIQGIKNLSHAGMRIHVHTVISQESTNSKEDIDAILDLCSNLGVETVHFVAVYATGRASQKNLKLEREAKLQPLIEYLHQLKKSDDSILGKLPLRKPPQALGLSHYDGCGNCGLGYYAYISYNGMVYPCANHYKTPWALGNIRNGRIDHIWPDSPVLQYLRSNITPSEEGADISHIG